MEQIPKISGHFGSNLDKYRSTYLDSSDIKIPKFSGWRHSHDFLLSRYSKFRSGIVILAHRFTYPFIVRNLLWACSSDICEYVHCTLYVLIYLIMHWKSQYCGDCVVQQYSVIFFVHCIRSTVISPTPLKVERSEASKSANLYARIRLTEFIYATENHCTFKLNTNEIGA